MGTPPKTRYQLWQETVDRGPTDPAWSAYDADLQTMAAEINAHLRATPGFQPLDWQFVKAMIWTESGATSPQWTVKPMQIGVPGDPGLAAPTHLIRLFQHRKNKAGTPYPALIPD